MRVFRIAVAAGGTNMVLDVSNVGSGRGLSPLAKRPS